MTTARAMLLLAVLCTAGFALGWAILPQSAPPDDRPDPAPDSPKMSPLVESSQRFKLAEADEKLDRERPALAVDARGRALLAWSSQTGADEYTLFLARSEDGGTFDAPVGFRKVPIRRHKSVMRGREVIRPTVVLPRLAAFGDTFVLGWTEPDGPGVVFRVARSQDGGRTFSPSVPMHGPAASRPNFTSLALGPAGSACAWLDRHGSGQRPFFALLADGATGGKERLVCVGPSGKGVCPCCDTDILCAPDGTTFVAYRDADSGYRDIAVCRAPAGGAFEAPVPVSAAHWSFDGCPHDGPSLARTGRRLHVAWMDARDGRQRVHVASSALDKLDFSERPLAAESPGEQVQPRLAAGEDTLHAVWSESLSTAAPPEKSNGDGSHHHHDRPLGPGRLIVYARSDGDARFTAPEKLAPVEGVYQLRPTLAVGPHGPLVAWFELKEKGKDLVCVRLKRLPASRE
jgi:hypothetical protein